MVNDGYPWLMMVDSWLKRMVLHGKKHQFLQRLVMKKDVFMHGQCMGNSRFNDGY